MRLGFLTQWDTYIHGVLWAYRNTPHESTESVDAEDCGIVHHVVDSPVGATERKMVYPLWSRQRQAWDELIGGEE